MFIMRSDPIPLLQKLQSDILIEDLGGVTESLALPQPRELSSRERARVPLVYGITLVADPHREVLQGPFGLQILRSKSNLSLRIVSSSSFHGTVVSDKRLRAFAYPRKRPTNLPQVPLKLRLQATLVFLVEVQESPKAITVRMKSALENLEGTMLVDVVRPTRSHSTAFCGSMT